MGLLSTLLDWISSLRTPARDSVAEDAPPMYRCAICGTPADSPDGPCSLCGSTDLVAGDDAPGGDSDGLDPDNVTRTTVADSDPAGKSPEERLRRLSRSRGDPLREHPDAWERRPERGGYAVTLPGDEVRYVPSKDEVRSTLREYYE